MPASSPFDLDLLRTFVAIVENGGFTSAAGRVGRTQSAVSLQVRRLEEGLCCRVFERGGRGTSPRLTPVGEVLLTYARRILHLCDEARSRLVEPDARGMVRLGTPEDFATVHLPDVLARFARAHPRVSLEVTCDYTVNLLDGFSKGLYDLVLFKREPRRVTAERDGLPDGVGVWREVLVWAASPRLVLDAHEDLPLVLAPAPDVYRGRALAALDAVHRSWRVVYTSPSLAGLQAAVRAGLGVTVLPRGMLPQGAIALSEAEHRLPALPDTQIVLYRAPGELARPAELIAEHITQSLGTEATGVRDSSPEGAAIRI